MTSWRTDMPSRPPAICHHPGCPHLTPCPTHKPSHRTRINPRSKIYNTKRWRNLRRDKLTANPQCEANGCTAPATDVDHIVRLRTGGAPYDWANLQALCHSHHSAKTAVEMSLGHR
jgi:5-methylcytosine-specific restriction enzyme A